MSETSIDVQRVESKIEAVTLYRSGARVARSVVVEAKNGRLPQQVEFSSLPLALVDETVRVQITGVSAGSEEAQALAVADFRVGLSAHAPSDVVAPPEEGALEAASQALLKKTKLLQQIGQERAILDGIELPPRPEGEEGRQPPASPMAARMALEQFSHEALERRIKASQDLQAEIEVLQEEVASLRMQLERVREGKEIKPHSLFKVVQARIRQGDASHKQVRLVLSYFVPGATWVPTYQCRLESDGTRAAIQMRALISQRTGEDWRRVKLSLSTADPMRWAELPELTSLRIGEAQPAAAKRGFRPPPKGSSALFGDFDRGLENAMHKLPAPTDWSPVPLYTAPLSESAPPPPPKSIQLDDEDEGYMYTSKDDLPTLSTESAKTLRMAVPAPKPKRRSSDGISKLSSKALSSGLDMDAMPIEEEIDADMSVGRSFAVSASSGVADAFGGVMDSMDFMESMDKERAPAKPMMKKKRKSQALFAERVTLHYTQLHLGKPESPIDRGRLLPIDVAARYAKTLRRGGWDIRFDAMTVVREATQRAHTVADQPLPDGTTNVKHAAGHFDYTYETDASVDVPGDGQAHSIAVGSREAPCDMHYVVVPREDPQAYRIASLRNPLHAPLLPGPAEVYIGGEYILSTQLPVVPPNADLQLWLGVEQAIKCARNTRYREERSGTKVVAMNELHHEIDIEVANRLGRDIRCEVHERIPQPDEDAEIVVEEGEVTPAWAPYDQEERGHVVSGGRRWQVSIPAGDKAELRATYTIKIYANNEIVGGNRREA